MGRVAVLMAEGYEEGETLTIVDLLRRGGLECHTFSFNEEFVRGMHGMYKQISILMMKLKTMICLFYLEEDLVVKIY